VGHHPVRRHDQLDDEQAAGDQVEPLRRDPDVTEDLRPPHEEEPAGGGRGDRPDAHHRGHGGDAERVDEVVATGRHRPDRHRQQEKLFHVPGARTKRSKNSATATVRIVRNRPDSRRAGMPTRAPTRAAPKTPRGMASQKLQWCAATSEPTVKAPTAAKLYWQNEIWPTKPVSSTSDSTMRPKISPSVAREREKSDSIAGQPTATTATTSRVMRLA